MSVSETDPSGHAVILDVLREVFEYASQTDDWIVIKKEVLRALPARLRKHFSLRHPITKKQQTNDFERELAEEWSRMSGREVLFRDDETDKQAPT